MFSTFLHAIPDLQCRFEQRNMSNAVQSILAILRGLNIGQAFKLTKINYDVTFHSNHNNTNNWSWLNNKNTFDKQRFLENLIVIFHLYNY